MSAIFCCFNEVSRIINLICITNLLICGEMLKCNLILFHASLLMKWDALRITSKFHIISWCGTFVERHNFRRVLGGSLETMRKLCVSTKLSNQEIRWKYDILCSSISWDNTVTHSLQCRVSVIQKCGIEICNKKKKRQIILYLWESTMPLIFSNTLKFFIILVCFYIQQFNYYTNIFLFLANQITFWVLREVMYSRLT